MRKEDIGKVKYCVYCGSKNIELAAKWKNESVDFHCKDCDNYWTME